MRTATLVELSIGRIPRTRVLFVISVSSISSIVLLRYLLFFARRSTRTAFSAFICLALGDGRRQDPQRFYPYLSHRFFFHFETVRTANASTVNSESASDDTHLGAEQN